METDIRILHERFKIYLATSYAAVSQLKWEPKYGSTSTEIMGFERFCKFWDYIKGDSTKHPAWLLRLSEGGFEAETRIIDEALSPIPKLHGHQRAA